MAKRQTRNSYSINDLMGQIKGVYSEPLNANLANVLTAIKEEEQARGVDQTFDDLEGVIGYAAGVLGENYAGPMQNLLQRTLKLKENLEELFPDQGYQESTNSGKSVRVSLRGDFKKSLKKRGLKGKKLEAEASYVACQYRDDPRIVDHTVKDGRKRSATNFKAYLKGVDAITKEHLEK